jgi:hypothetical protein
VFEFETFSLLVCFFVTCIFCCVVCVCVFLIKNWFYKPLCFISAGIQVTEKLVLAKAELECVCSHELFS